MGKTVKAFKKLSFGKECGLISQTVAGNQAYLMTLNVFVHLYAFKLKDHISIENCRCKCGSCQSLNQVVELEAVCLPKLTVSWPKTTKLLRQKDCPNLHFAEHSIQGLTPFV